MTDRPDAAADVSASSFAVYAAVVIAGCLVLLVPMAVAAPGLPFNDWRYWLFAALVLVGELMPIDVRAATDATGSPSRAPSPLRCSCS